MKNFQWKFNPPCAPHMGGVWERLIRSVKNALKVILNKQVTRDEVLVTIFAEIKHLINSRPLTKVSSDPKDYKALTPNHFLIGSSSGSVNFHGHTTNTFNFRKQWRVAQHYTNLFWTRWLREYVPTLLARQKWLQKDDPLKIGDIVLIVDDQAPRNVWRKALVVKIFPNEDGQVRSAEVRTASGVLIRGTRYLIRLADCEI